MYIMNDKKNVLLRLVNVSTQKESIVQIKPELPLES